MNPLEIAPGLVDLFLRNERPEFPAWFHRAYPIAVRDGAASWVAADSNDRIIAHVAALPSRFAVGPVEVRGFLLSNLMADREHRSFFPIVSVVKRAIRDLKTDGAAFVYTDPTNEGAVSVMRAAGMSTVGTLNRFLLPLGKASMLHVAATVVKWRRTRGLERVEARPIPVGDAIDWTVRERRSDAPVTPRRSRDLYFMRLGELEDPGFRGCLFADGSGNDVGACVLDDRAEDSVLVTLRCRSSSWVAPCARTLGKLQQANGKDRIHTYALEDSPHAQALIQAGFFLRKEPWAVVARAFTDEGRRVVEGLGASDVEKIDLD